jgi:NAD+ kinase
MLAAARNLVRHGVPLAGVNLGRLGFMTDIALKDMPSSIGTILDGRYVLEERALLEAEIRREAEILHRTLALNEAVVGKGSQGRLIEFEVYIDGEYVYTLRADGVIVATPTGSTAYALSAQGPILHPGVGAFALVPLNPHTLSARPVSVSDRSVIEIVLVRALDARAHFDGYALADMAQGDRLVLRRSGRSVRFVHPPGYSYFVMLREKLRWSEAVDRGRDPGEPD